MTREELLASAKAKIEAAKVPPQDQAFWIRTGAIPIVDLTEDEFRAMYGEAPKRRPK